MKVSATQAAHDVEPIHRASVEPPRRSPYSLRAKVGRVLWSLAWGLLWRPSPSVCWWWRRALLRAFGGRVEAGACLDPRVRIEIPWNLRIGRDARVCEFAILYCLGEVTIGADTFIGPFVHVCAGTHDYTDSRFTLVRSPIRIGPRCVLLTAAFVAPGVTLAEGTVLKPRAGAFRDTAANTTYEGSPAHPVASEPKP